MAAKLKDMVDRGNASVSYPLGPEAAGLPTAPGAPEKMETPDTMQMKYRQGRDVEDHTTTHRAPGDE